MSTEPTDLLRQTETYLSALHQSVARHDNLGADLTCHGCQLREQISTVLAAQPVQPSAPADTDLRERVADGQGEPAELRDLPREVRKLVHAADRMRSEWAESSDERQAELWTALHEATDAVWHRPLAVLPAPADRAAVLREAADAVAQDRDTTTPGGGKGAYRRAMNRAEQLLRRMADEAQQVCIHPEGYEGECPCPPSCSCCMVTAAEPVPADRAAVIRWCATQVRSMDSEYAYQEAADHLDGLAVEADEAQQAGEGR